MRRIFIALMLALAAPVCHAGDTAAADIRAGRAALVAGQPQSARAHFAVALARAGADRAARFVALVGLGRAQLWLGSYADARESFAAALPLAQTATDREAAATGLAQADNALDYPRRALAMVQGFAPGRLEPTLETLKAQRALGWQDLSVPYLAAMGAVPAQGRLGEEYARLRADADYAVGKRVQGDFSYQHDSDNLTTWAYGAGASLPGTPGGGWFPVWKLAAHAIWVNDGAQAAKVNDLDGGLEARIGRDQRLGLRLGAGQRGGWSFLQGRAGWEYRPTDRFGLNASAERAPIYTPAALDRHVLYDTYTLGVSLRPGAHWYVLPAAYHQNFSDGNRRDGGVLRVILSPYDLPGTASALGAEFYGRVFRSTLPGGGLGYFNPAHYDEAQLSLIAIHRLAADWRLRAQAGLGSQTADGTSAGTYALELTLQGRLPGNGRLSARLGRSNVASVSGGGTGYWNNYLAVTLGYPF